MRKGGQTLQGCFLSGLGQGQTRYVFRRVYERQSRYCFHQSKMSSPCLVLCQSAVSRRAATQRSQNLLLVSFPTPLLRGQRGWKGLVSM